MTRRHDPSWSERCYGALVLVAYPASFRERFGDELGELFRDCYYDARARGGPAALCSLWLRMLADLVSSGVRERVAAFTTRKRLAPLSSDTPFPHRPVNLPRALLSDVHFALRVFRKNPVFFAIAVLVVSLGTGAVSTIFSVANAIILRPIPATRDASRIVEVDRTRGSNDGSLSASYPYYRHLRARTKSLDGLAAWGMVSLTMSTGGQGIQTLGNAVSGNYFSVLGVRPALGTFPTTTDDRTIDPVAVISYAVWQRQLAGDSSVIGRAISINGRPMTIVGVAPPNFRGVWPTLKTDVWLPLAVRPLLHGRSEGLDDAGSAWMQLVGRLAMGRSAREAARELTTLTAQYIAGAGGGEAKDMNRYDAARVASVAGVPADVAGAVAGFFGILLAIAALVLLIASTNVASMLLARAVTRRREIAMRMALGASRRRLIRQLLVESMLLFGAGGAAGILVAFGGTRLLQRIELPIDVPLELDATPDLRVLVVTLVVALATGLLFGLAPAFQGSRLDVQGTLRSDSAGAGRRKSRLRDALIVAQIAMSLVLLSSAGLFVRALGKGRATDPGFGVDGVVTTSIDVESAGYTPDRARALYRELTDRLSTVPGVQSVAWGRLLPLSMSRSAYDVSIPNQGPPGGRVGDRIQVSANDVDEGYFAALRIPLVRGRGFARTDDERASRVAVVNETFARRYFAGSDAVGATFREDSSLFTIVGVVRDSKFSRLDEEAEPFVYFPTAQHWRSVGNLLVRTTGTTESAGAAIVRALATLDPSLPVPRITTLQRATAVVLLPQRVAAAVTGALGLIGLLLAAVGLYGVLSFSTAQRTREIGVRLALGSSRAGIMRMVLREGSILVGIGVGSGLLVALLATRALRPFLFGLDPLDPLTFSVIAATLVAVSAIATALPARRASGVDPMQSMRQD